MPSSCIPSRFKKKAIKSHQTALNPVTDEGQQSKEGAEELAPYKPRSHTRIWKVTNPLEFPPNEYHRSLFKCNHPFITLSYEMPDHNKFGHLQMRPETRRAALEFLLEPSLRIFRSHEVKGELNGCQLHSALFQNIWGITKPSKLLLESINEMEEAYELKYNKKRQKIEQDIGEDQNTDLVIADLEKYPKLVSSNSKRSDRSDESFKMDEEVRPDDGEQTGRGRMDIRMFVYNTLNQKLKAQFEETHAVDPCKSVCIVECKWDDKDEKALYQAACYACQEALKNLSNLHFEPIYILALSHSEWTYGLLDFRGRIHLTNGKIEHSSLPRFTKQEGIRFSNDRMPIGALEGQLEKSTAYYRERFSESPNAVYPTNVYLVGTLYLAKKWYRLPVFGTIGGATDYGVHLFFEGLMRMIIGDKVISWHKEDLAKAKELKDRIMQVDKELIWA